MDIYDSDEETLWIDLMLEDYEQMHRIQKILHKKREHGHIPNVVLMLEHTPSITIGSSGGHQHLLANAEILQQHGIKVHETSRGGDITYHGPGQLVCYPIIALRGEQRDLHAYARNMEEVMIQTVRCYGINAGRKSKFPGAWVGGEKIGAMGIAVRKWTTMHGIALNVCPDLRHFSFIVPCGITAHSVTSMQQQLGYAPHLMEVRQEMRHQFSTIFKFPLRSASLEQLLTEDSLETA